MSYSSADVSLRPLLAAPAIADRAHRKALLCGPGPADVWPSMQAALTGPIMSPLDEEYFHQLDDIRNGLRYVFQTKTNLVLAISGSGHSGMETIISNLLAPGQTLLVAARGIWDERAAIMAKRYGSKVVVHRVPPNCTHDLKDLEMAVKRVRPTAVFITHGDSSTGTVQYMPGLGDMCTCGTYGALLLVDTVVSLVGVPFLMDEWKVDAVYTSTQKAFSGPTALAPVAFSTRAEVVISNRKHEPPFYFDVKLLAEQWNCYGDTKVYHHTLSSPMVAALRCCLKEIIKETLPAAWARHADTANHFQERLQRIRLSAGIEFYAPKAEDRLATVTTVVLPAGYEYMDVVKYIKAKHNIQIFGGLGPTAGKVLRIGLMGVNSTREVADRVADGLAEALVALKKSKL